jgi:riboflavin kinase/FMN adenylyltransferase
MKVYRSPKDIAPRPSAVALGFFDGLHLGHTSLLSRSVAFARARGLSADVFTFRAHPKNVMAGKMVVPFLLTETEKLERMDALGVDRVFDFDFADGFHKMPPGRFAGGLLKGVFAAEAVFCGFNFRFGAEAAGDTEALCLFGKELGFETYVIDPVYVNNRLVSSTLIRRCIKDGDMEHAGRMLGRSYALSGIVTEGRRLGRSFGFPTANFAPDPALALPARGVYVTETRVAGQTPKLFASVTNVGVNPTVSGDGAVRAETHLLDAEQDLYGQTIEVLFKKRLREERRFENEDALKRQIAADAETARLWFAASGLSENAD